MFKRKLLTLAAGSLLLAASSAFAHDGYGHWRHGYRGYGYGHFYAPRVVVLPPAPVFYAPAPVYYPRPVVVAPPVYVAPRPTIVYRQPGFSLAVGF